MNRTRSRRRRIDRRAFSFVEMLIALAISAMLLTAVMGALQASLRAYQGTTEWASRCAVARLTMHRILTMIRTGTDFGPFPANVLADPVLESDFIEFVANTGEVLRIEYRPDDETLYVIQDPGGAAVEDVLMTGMPPQFDELGERILPFTLHYEIGPSLYRATVDFLIANDPDVELEIESDDVPPIRLVASIVPRNNM
ncbi:MAG: type II secretion system protein J [Phycisphaerales bacterium]